MRQWHRAGAKGSQGAGAFHGELRKAVRQDKGEILLMEEILHQLVGRLSHSLQGFYTSQVVSRISFINSII